MRVLLFVVMDLVVVAASTNYYQYYGTVDIAVQFTVYCSAAHQTATR